MNQEIASRWTGMKEGIKHFVEKFTHDEGHTSNDGEQSQPDGVRRNYDDSTAGETEAKAPIAGKAEKNVRENENASLQDKSYSFDEEVTDADYDREDSLNFTDDETDLRV